jgi:Uma2 family endonuclease
MALSSTHSPLHLQPRTYDDLLAMPEDGHRYELIYGEIVMSPSPKTKHQRAVVQLAEAFNRYVREHRLGEVFVAPFDVKLSPHSVVQPDLLYVKRERSRIVTEDFVDGPPDLIIEVLSASNRMQDLVKKAALYAEHGVPEYWIVDPESEQIGVNVWEDGQYVPVTFEDAIARSVTLPGLEVSPSEIFALPEWLRPKTDESE